MTELEVITYVVTLCAAGAIAGITSGLFGNGGGFVVVPALLAVFPFFPGDPATLIYVAIGTSLATIIISSTRAVQAHRRRGAVDFVVLKDWSIWLVIGVSIGLVIASFTQADKLTLLFAIGVFAYSFYFLFPRLLDRFGGDFQMPRGLTRAGLASFLGGFSALLGIGGGTITVMTMVICKRPVHQAVATAAGVGFIIALPGAIGFLVRGLTAPGLPWGSVGYVNIPALVAIGAGSIITAPIGARWAHELDEDRLKRLFGAYLLIVSFSMFYKSLG